MPRPACKECNWFQSIGGNRGYCKARAPAITDRKVDLGDGKAEDKWREAMWPIVSGDDWCGDWCLWIESWHI